MDGSYRDTQEIRFWQQANSLIQGEKFYEGVETAKMFWWFNQSAPVRYSATPKPHYGCDGSKVFDVLDQTECNLTERLGPFPFFSFWGPAAGLPSSRVDRRGDRNRDARKAAATDPRLLAASRLRLSTFSDS